MTKLEAHEEVIAARAECARVEGKLAEFEARLAAIKSRDRGDLAARVLAGDETPDHDRDVHFVAAAVAALQKAAFQSRTKLAWSTTAANSEYRASKTAEATKLDRRLLAALHEVAAANEARLELDRVALALGYEPVIAPGFELELVRVKIEELTRAVALADTLAKAEPGDTTIVRFLCRHGDHEADAIAKIDAREAARLIHDRQVEPSTLHALAGQKSKTSAPVSEPGFLS